MQDGKYDQAALHGISSAAAALSTYQSLFGGIGVSDPVLGAISSFASFGLARSALRVARNTPNYHAQRVISLEKAESFLGASIAKALQQKSWTVDGIKKAFDSSCGDWDSYYDMPIMKETINIIEAKELLRIINYTKKVELFYGEKHGLDIQELERQRNVEGLKAALQVVTLILLFMGPIGAAIAGVTSLGAAAVGIGNTISNFFRGLRKAKNDRERFSRALSSGIIDARSIQCAGFQLAKLWRGQGAHYRQNRIMKYSEYIYGLGLEAISLRVQSERFSGMRYLSNMMKGWGYIEPPTE